ncbi:MAG: hypothetical protein GXY32_00035 [Ruminococcaceae bacterium]|nr:hypothetical protein [Oscillospiraceae bacterium]
MRRPAGKLAFSGKSIESAVYAAIKAYPDIGASVVHIKGTPTPEKLRLQVDIEPRTPTVPIQRLAESVQTGIVEAIAMCLALNVDTVDVTVHPRAYRPTPAKHVPRVI